MFLRRSKLRAPTLSASWIPRAELSAALRPGISVLAIVAGPGYGKTVLASQLAAAWSGPVFWYACDQADADLAVFAAHLNAMIAGRQFEPTAPAATPPTTAEEVGANAAESLAALLNALVIFDDVQVLHGQSLAAFKHLVDRASASGVSFVMSGRESPLPLHGLAARGRLATLSMDELAFDDAASRDYLNTVSAGRLESDRVADLVRRIGGWPAGLALAASMPSRKRRGGNAPDDASLEMLFDYLAAEVLDALDGDDRTFLLDTSILEDLEIEVCDAVTGRSDSRQRLTRLSRRGLFIARSRADAFEAHGLFAAFLRDRLEREYSPAARAALHDRAAVIFARRGDDVKAIEHQIAAGRHDVAAESLAHVALALHASGATSQLERLLAGIGADRVAANPVLAIARGRLHYAAGAWDAALATLTRAEALARARELPDVSAEAVRAIAPILGARGEHERLGAILEAVLALPLSDTKRASVSITLGAHLLDRGRFDDVLALYARIGPAVADLADLALQGVLLHNTGVAHVRRGDPFAALGFYERALEIKRAAGQRVSALVTLGNLCVVLRALGDIPAATRIAAECTREARAVGNAAMLSHALENAGALALAAGELETAAELFAEACAACDPSDTIFLPDALLGLANVALARADAAAATAACARAATLLRAPGDEQRRAGVLAARARTALAAADPAAALGFANEALELASCGADTLATTTIGLEVAAVAAQAATMLTASAAEEARAIGRRSAQAAFALAATRDYSFLERAQPRAVTAARALVATTAAAAGAARIELLGPMRIYVAGLELPTSVWKRRKAREIFAYLVCERGRLVPRARLIDTFWPESDADGAGDNLRVTISAIRRAVGDVVRFETGGYRFEAPPGTAIDLDVLEAALAVARRARDLHDREAARAAYADALEAYRGDLLDGYEDGTWHLRERARLRDAALEAARALVADSQTSEAVRSRAIERLLQLAPFDVDAMRARLDGLAAARRIGEARGEYDRWRQRYTEVFGDAPPEFWQPPRLAVAPRAG